MSCRPHFLPALSFPSPEPLQPEEQSSHPVFIFGPSFILSAFNQCRWEDAQTSPGCTGIEHRRTETLSWDLTGPEASALNPAVGSRGAEGGMENLLLKADSLKSQGSS